MSKILQYILKKLKVKYWGAGWEISLPPEFIVTQHGIERLRERMRGFEKIHTELMITAWFDGHEPAAWFDPSKAKQEFVRKHYEKIIYKEHFGKIWIYGTRYREELGADQKFLITVYNRPKYV